MNAMRPAEPITCLTQRDVPPAGEPRQRLMHRLIAFTPDCVRRRRRGDGRWSCCSRIRGSSLRARRARVAACACMRAAVGVARATRSAYRDPYRDSIRYTLGCSRTPLFPTTTVCDMRHKSTWYSCNTLYTVPKVRQVPKPEHLKHELRRSSPKLHSSGGSFAGCPLSKGI